MSNQFNIVYSTDENYSVHAYISLNSLLDSNKCANKISIYIIENKLSLLTKNRFINLINSYNNSRCSVTLTFLNFLEIERYVIDARPCGSLSTYGRLFLPYFLNINKVLYIDCDTIIRGYIGDLFDIELDNVAVAGVLDIVSQDSKYPLGIDDQSPYINAGICLINLEYWKKTNAVDLFLKCIEKFDGKVPFEDQGVLNSVFKGHIMILEPKYNFMNHMIHMSASKISLLTNVKNYYSNKQIKDANSNPVIIHFTAGYYIRPWYSNCNHPYKKFYLNYLNKSPWNEKDIVKSKKHIFFKDFIRHIAFVAMPTFCLRLFKKMRK